MKPVTTFRANDGTALLTEQEASRYLDTTYANIVSKLASDLITVDKYQAMKLYIDENLRRFAQAIDAKAELDMWQEYLAEREED